MGLLAAGVTSLLAGCDWIGSSRSAGSTGALVGARTGAAPGPAAASTTAHPSEATIGPGPGVATIEPVTAGTAPPSVIPAANAGLPQVYSRAIGSTQQIALTIDDGFCQPCAQAYAEFAQSSGIHITFSPNGTYHDVWNPLAPILRPLIVSGQVQVGNHTYHHPDLTALSESRIVDEIERNESWIESTFGITARPWMRPPYGRRDQRTDDIAASVGYTKILMWSGSFGDSALLTPDELMAQARKWLRPGTIMLGHANHTTVIDLLPQIADLITLRDLEPVTLDEMFGTSRSIG